MHDAEAMSIKVIDDCARKVNNGEIISATSVNEDKNDKDKDAQNISLKDKEMTDEDSFGLTEEEEMIWNMLQ